MALTFQFDRGASARTSREGHVKAKLGLAYAWSAFAIMWAFWICFVVFLASPAQLVRFWPLPTVDQGGAIASPLPAAMLDLVLIALFGLQHSLMARPWFKASWAAANPAFERCTFVHMANAALFALIVLWQPIPIEIWSLPRGFLRDGMWLLFTLGWVILFAGAWSFGIYDLLGIDQMRRWSQGKPPAAYRLKTRQLYTWLRHPMYVGVLLGVWATPRMTAGHAFLAAGFTLYVLIAMRYEERDLERKFGSPYVRWRTLPQSPRQF
jgi:protein-S-isoprenylcysteine O-methyltransferase Ste14